MSLTLIWGIANAARTGVYWPGALASQWVVEPFNIAANEARLNGSYYMTSRDGGLRATGPWAGIFEYVNNATLIFDGAGGCSVSYSGTDMEIGIRKGLEGLETTIAASPDSGSLSCSYTLSSTGDLTLNFDDGDTASVKVSADGLTFVSSYYESRANDEKWMGTKVAIKVAGTQ